MKPIINLDELIYENDDGPGHFKQSWADVSSRIGAKRLGYNMTVCPPGHRAVPFHNHRVNEEMFFILEGEGCLRFGSAEYPVRAGDFVACPPGGREVAHQLINTGTVDLRYLSLSTMDATEVCEYPDSDKVGVFAGKSEQGGLRKLFRARQDTEYFDGEA